MRKRLPTAAAAALLLALASMVAADAAQPPASGLSTGFVPDRVVRISPTTRYVNAEPFETIRFVSHAGGSSETSFDYSFSIYDARVFPLAQIAPSGFPAGTVQVYLSRLPPGD
jgi:hypothetical protein